MKVKEMAKKTLKTLTLGEEIANAITHGVAALWVLIMFPIVSIIAWHKQIHIFSRPRQFIHCRLAPLLAILTHIF